MEHRYVSIMKQGETRGTTLTSPQAWPLSVKAYRALGEMGLIPKQSELLYGQVFQKMSKSPLHTAWFLRMLKLIQAVLPADCHVRPEQPLTCQDSEPEPDLAVVRGRAEDFWHEHPVTAELVVEICVSIHDYDRTKLRAYALAGVKECWFVLGPEKQVEIHRHPVGNTFTKRVVCGPGGQPSSTAIPHILVALDAVFAK